MQWDIGLEIGQTGVRLCTRERGETLVSPAWGASRKGETIALGDEALSMRGRTLKGVSVGRPVENGSVADPRLLGGWIARILGPLLSASRLSKPSVALVDSGFFRRSELDLMRAAVTELGASRCGFIQADLLAAIGSGGMYALAAAKALKQNTDLSAREIAEKALRIAGDICIYTNGNLVVEEI